MSISDLYQEHLRNAGVAPDSPAEIVPTQEDFDLVQEYLELGVSGLRVKQLAEDRKKTLLDSLELDQRISIGGVGYKRILPEVILTDYFDGYGPSGVRHQGH